MPPMNEHPLARRLASLTYQRLQEHRGLQAEASRRAGCGRNYWREAARGGALSTAAFLHAAETLKTPAWVLIKMAMEGEVTDADLG